MNTGSNTSAIPSSHLWRQMLGTPVIAVLIFALGSQAFNDESPLAEIYWLLIGCVIVVGGVLGLLAGPKQRRAPLPMGLVIVGGTGAILILVAVVPDEIGARVCGLAFALFVGYATSFSARELLRRKQSAARAEP